MRTFAETTTDIDRLLQSVAHLVSDSLADSCIVLALSPDAAALLPKAVHATDAPARARLDALVQEAPFSLDSLPLARRVLDQRGSLLLARVEPDSVRGPPSSPFARYGLEQGVHSLLIVALHANAKPLGVLILTRYRAASPPFNDHDRELAQNLADHAALALANARLYAAERAARLAAEEASRSSRVAEARFRHLASVGVMGVLVGRIDATIVDVNPYIEKMLGYSRAELVSGAVRWQDLTAPGWEHVDALAREQLTATGRAKLREKELIRRDGVRVPVLIGSAVLDDGRDILSFVLDLTERKRAEATVAQLEAEHAVDSRFRVVLEAAPDPIVVTNGADRVTFVNGRACDVLGYRTDDLIGTPIERLLPDSADPGPARIGRRQDGTEVPLEVTASTLEAGEETLVVRALRDTTERTRALAAVHRAKAEAEAAYAELEAFSYSVAHDLRTPLRAVNGFARIVLEEHAAELDVEGKALLDRVVHSACNMGALIDALLSLARLSRMPLNREPVDLSALARAALRQALEEAPPDRPVTELTIAERLVVNADPTLLRALVSNLVTNAVKFTARARPPRIEVGETRVDDERVFFFRDNGAGFDMTYANMLFTPFQRLHDPGEFPGTGIGLATVKRVVGRHGGKIWAVGEVEGGATFSFTLPGS